MKKLVPIALAVLVTGCPPSFDGLGVVVEDVDGSVARRDAAVIPRVDGGTTMAGPCGYPQLLVMVENLGSSGPVPGNILRFQLDAFPETGAHQCGTLSGGGRMVQQPWTAVQGPDGRIYVGGDDAIQAIVPISDVIFDLVEAPEVPNRPTDSFLLRAPDGSTRVAFAFTAVGTSGDIRNVWTFGTAGVVDRWQLNDGVFPLGLSVTSMTSSPVHPERLLALRNDMWAAAEVDPFMRVRYDMPPFVTNRDGFVLRTVSALDDGATNRVAWSGTQDGHDAAFAITDSMGVGDLRVPLPERCDETMCDSFLHAVPDPTEFHRVIALCETNGPPRVRKVVRFSTTGNPCEVLVDDASVGRDRRFSRLAVTVAP